MSLFSDALSIANTAFGAIAGETFEVAAGKTGNLGIPGTYSAISIDDLVAASAVAPGGFKGENTVLMFVANTVMVTSGIRDGCVLIVRGNRLRVTSIADDGDNVKILTCTGAGVRV